MTSTCPRRSWHFRSRHHCHCRYHRSLDCRSRYHRYVGSRGILASLIPALTLLVLLGACTDSPTEPDETRELAFDFDESSEGWTGDFADYPTDKSAEDMDLMFERRALPDDVDEDGRGLLLTGRNESDDLFMYLRHEVTGLEPNTGYSVSFRLSIASNAPSGCVGIGGPPGEAVVVKVGASVNEPIPIVEGDHYRLSVDKDSEDADDAPGSSVKEIGNVANGIEQCTGEIPYQIITLQNLEDPLQITTEDDGSLWLFVGTDSGFEGVTALYYDEIDVIIATR